MTRTGYVSTIAALACAVTATTAWADAAETGVTATRDHNVTSKQIATELLREVCPGPYGLRVQSRNGYVRLSGSVATARDWKKAEQTARDAVGETEVRNDLSILIR